MPSPHRLCSSAMSALRVAVVAAGFFGTPVAAQQLEDLSNLDALNPPTEEDGASGSGDGAGANASPGVASGAATGSQTGPRAAPSETPATVPGTAAKPDGKPATGLKPPRKVVFSFGLHGGQPTGLQGQVRLWNRNAVVATVGYDWFYKGLNATVDYRFTVYNLEVLRYDLQLGFWAGVGARLAALEPYRPYQRNFRGFGFGARIPVGVTLRLRPLPVEFGAYVSPLGGDFNGLLRPRWRPEGGVEVRMDFPYSPL